MFSVFRMLKDHEKVSLDLGITKWKDSTKLVPFADPASERTGPTSNIAGSDANRNLTDIASNE